MQRYTEYITKQNVFLDKLVQLESPPYTNAFRGAKITVNNSADEKKVNTISSLKKRAKAKHLTNAYTIKLACLRSPLQKSYNNTIYGCCNVLQQSNKRITGVYCNNRWCLVCNRIRTAKLINGYKQPLESIVNKQFVTLTIKNVDSGILRDTIKDMTRNFQNAIKYMRKREYDIIGLRKLECTYNPQSNTYHPHFHIIVNGKRNAEQLVKEWLKRNPTANIIAQDVRQADASSMMEMFKYFNKIISDKHVYIKPLDNIFQAMRGLRVYQNFGIRKVSEDIEELQSEIIEELERAEKNWNWIEHDWIDKETGECLTEYTPSEEIITLIDHFT